MSPKGSQEWLLVLVVVGIIAGALVHVGPTAFRESVGQYEEQLSTVGGNDG